MSSKMIAGLPCAAIFACLMAVSAAQGQVNPGYPSWSAYDSHEIDTVNLQDLNVVLNIPVFSKSGAFPLNVNLEGSHYFVNQGGEWFLLGALSAYGNSILGSGNVWASYSITSSSTCPGGGGTTLYQAWYIQTGDGAFHSLPTSDYTDSAGCLKASFTDAVIDGTGYTLTATGGSASYVYTRSGMRITIGINDVGQLKDSNGNTITFSGVATYKYTDTLGLNALTQNGGTTGATLTWTDSNGNPQSLTPTYSSSTYGTDFGCVGIIDPRSNIWTKVTNLGFPDGTNIGITYEQTPNSPNSVTGRFKQLTLREGGTITYAYSGGSNNSGINCTYGVVPTLQRTTADGTTTYNWAAVNNGSGNWGNTTTVTDQGGNQTVYTFTGLTSTGNAAAPVVQALTQVKHYQGTSTLLTTDVYCYNGLGGQPRNCSTAVVSMPITEVDVYHTINGMSTSSRRQTMYDKYGNVSYAAQYDFGGSSPVVATTITYGSCTADCTASNPTISVIGSSINDRPGRTLTTGSGSSIADSRYFYDSHGNLVTTYVWNGSSWLSNTTPNVYNSNGTPSTTYDVANNPTTYLYDASGYVGCPETGCITFPFPTSVSKGGITVQSTWNAIGGVKLTDVDANSQTTTYGYVACSGGAADPFWRVTSLTDSLSNQVCRTYPSGSSPNAVSSGFSFNSNASVQNTMITTDGYGRETNLQTQQGPLSANYDTVSTEYSWSGNYRSVSNSQPCTEPLNGSCTTVHTASYDPLGRLYQKTTTANETVTHTYTQNDDLVKLTPAPTNENSKQVQTQYDGLGRIQYSCAVGNGYTNGCSQNTGSTTGVTTSYSYTYGSGSATTTATRGPQSRIITVDAMGRITSVATPEGGAVTNTYDTPPSFCGGSAVAYSGKLLASRSANGNYSCYVYDSLGRVAVITGSYGSGGGLCRRFYYDNSTGALGTIPNGVSIANPYGRVVEAETDTCAWPITTSSMITDEWFSYDSDGNMTGMWEKTPHSGQYYHSNAAFYGNRVIRTLQLASPSLYTMNYGIDGEGRWNTLMEGTTQSIVTNNTSYNAAGEPTEIALTGTDQDDYVYDSNTGLMTNFTFQVGSSPKTLVGQVNWNANRTLNNVAITDGFNSSGT